MPIDLSIILTTTRHKDLTRTLSYLQNQSYCGFEIEVIIIAEMDKSAYFNINTTLPFHQYKIVQRPVSGDFGASAKDLGISMAKGTYVAFWDDDNLFENHALVALYGVAYGFDIGLVRTHHLDSVIPTSAEIMPGDIDTMCLCVRKTLAMKEKWATANGRYADYRWLRSLLLHKPSINRSQIIIGRHLV